MSPQIASNPTSEQNITSLLTRWVEGEPAVLDELVPMVYRRLRALAGSLMREERPEHTLQPTALVHEMFVAMSEHGEVDYRDREHFYATAGRMMRHILIDHARRLRRQRRGGGAIHTPLEDGVVDGTERGLDDLINLAAQLDRLAELDARKARVIELRFFAGFSVEETAAILHVSVPTVVLDARLARAWLFARLRRTGS